MQEGGDEYAVIPVDMIAKICKRTDHCESWPTKGDSSQNLQGWSRKAANQAIFAMRCGNVQHASKLLNKCTTCINDQLLPILNDEPLPRHGSFSGLIKENVGEILFYTWLQGDASSDGNTSTGGEDLLPNEISLKVSTDDTLEACAIWRADRSRQGGCLLVPWVQQINLHDSQDAMQAGSQYQQVDGYGQSKRWKVRASLVQTIPHDDDWPRKVYQWCQGNLGAGSK